MAEPGLQEPELELRCPDPWEGRCSAGRLLAKLRLSGQSPSYVHPDNLIELECQDCKSRMRKAGRAVIRVLHRFDFAGTPAGTLVVEEDQGGLTGPAARTTGMGNVGIALCCVGGTFAAACLAARLRWWKCCDLPERAERGERFICRHGRAFQVGHTGWNRISRRAYLRREGQLLGLDVNCLERQER